MPTRSFLFACVALGLALAGCGGDAPTLPALSLPSTAPQPAFTAFAVPYLTQIQTAPIIAGPDHALWFSEDDSGGALPSLIGRITTAGTLTQFARGVTGSAAITGFTNGADGDIYFGQQPAIMGRITTAGTVAALPLGTAGVISLATGSDGAVWFTENRSVGFNSDIGRIDPAGNVTQIPLPSSLIVVPDGIAAGTDGALYVTDAMGPHIVRVTVAGAVSAIPVPATVNPSDIVSGPDGAMWFLAPVTNEIGRVAIGSHAVTLFSTAPLQNPEKLTAGPDGALWFTYGQGGSIGRMTTAGVLSTFTVPPAANASSVSISGMAAGPDQAIWFTDLFGNRVCRLSVTAPRVAAGRQRQKLQGRP